MHIFKLMKYVTFNFKEFLLIVNFFVHFLFLNFFPFREILMFLFTLAKK